MHYAHVDVRNRSYMQMRLIMGPSGKYLKNLAFQCGVSKIYWNQSNKVIEIWGPYDKMWSAQKVLQAHISYALWGPKYIRNESTGTTEIVQW